MDASPQPSNARPPGELVGSLEPQALPGLAGALASEEPRYRGPDRRKRPTPRFSRFTWFGGMRRSGGRRPGESEGAFVDQYSGRLVFAMALVAVLNSLDSFFTLLHLQAGGIELNPVAESMLRTGRLSFVLLKALLIIVPLAVLTMHKNFKLARVGIWSAAGAYGVLVLYHLSLL